MNKNIITKIIAGLSALLLVLPCLTSCTSIPSEKAIVGTVGEKDIYYDEIYYLVSNYKPSVEKSFGKGTDASRKELNRLVKENIIINYAYLAVCEKAGIEYDDVKNNINKTLDSIITTQYNDSKSAYKKDLKKNGLTERYHKYMIGLELMQEQLGYKYAAEGLILDEEAAIISYIKENFVLTNHLALFTDEGEISENNVKKLEEAALLLQSGEKSLIQLIAEGYSEDMSDISGKGYCFPKGSMVEEYENAAFALEIGQTSNIVKASSVSPSTGNTVECYYIIHRYELTDRYINENYNSLKNEYINSVINEDYQKILKKLTFKSNDAYDELDLLALKEPTSSTSSVIIISTISSLLALGAVITVVIIKKTRLKKKNLPIKKTEK